MAATPRKAAATLARYGDRSIVLIAGGSTDAGGGPVHASPEEQELLERACDEIARVARVVVVFGAAASRLAPPLQRRGIEPLVAQSLGEAVALAAQNAPGAAAVVFSPLFPLTLAERAAFAELVDAERARADRAGAEAST